MEATWQKRGFWISLVAVVVLILVAIGLKVVLPADGDAAAALNADDFAPNKNLEACAVKVLEGQGFARQDIAVGSEIDASLDVATTGDGRFGDRIETPQQAVDFFASGTPQAEVALATGQAQGFTRDELLDPSNAISVQILTDFTWPDNLGFVNGTAQSFGSRDDPAGTIGVLYIVGCDENGEVNEDAGGKILTFIVRGVCANPQSVLPRPKPVTPTEPTTPPTPEGCPQPYDRPGFGWNPDTCEWYKLSQSFDQQQNGNYPTRQDPQDNTTAENNGVNTGRTPGAPATEPQPNPVVPAPAPGTPAPAPTPGGYNSGGGAGSAPGGTTTSPGGTTSTGPAPGTTNPVDTGQGGNNGTDGTNSTGGGTIEAPDW